MPGFGDQTPLVFVGFIALGIVLTILGVIQKKRRREALAKFAHTMGFTFDPSHDFGFDSRFGRFEQLRKGSRRYAFNIMSGRYRDRGVLAFDYHYETYSHSSKGGRRTHHHYFSAVIVDAGLPLKPLLIRPEGVFDKVTEFLGYDDIDFESHEFSRRFYVNAEDRKWAFDVIHQETMEYLLHAPRYHIEMDGAYVIACRKTRFSTEEFQEALALIDGILSRLPDYLMRELKGELR